MRGLFELDGPDGLGASGLFGGALGREQAVMARLPSSPRRASATCGCWSASWRQCGSPRRTHGHIGARVDADHAAGQRVEVSDAGVGFDRRT